jgi:O-antigen/teichoic acid export membrane protein
MSEVRKSIVFSSLSSYSVMLLGLLTIMIVARLLTPDQLGIYAIASSIILVISEFRILGAGAYLIRETELTSEKIRSALGVTILISWSLGIAVIVGAPFVGRYYNLSAIETVFRILSISFFIVPFVSIPSALYARKMKFNLLFRMRLSGAITNLCVTLALIYAGMGFYSLAWGQTSGIAIQGLIAATFLRPDKMEYRPLFKRIGEIASLGIFNSVASVFRKATVIIPDLIIGKMGTTYDVGMFSRGLGFIQFVSQSVIMGVSPVALPYLSGARREGGDVRFAYQRAAVLLGGMVWPVLIVGSLASLPAIRLFFGDQWDAAAPLASWLAIWAALRSVHWFSNDLLLATHHEKVMVIKDAMIFAVLFAGIVWSYPSGLESVAKVFMFVGILEVIMITCLLRVYINLPIWSFIKAWFPNILVATGCGLVALGVKQVINFETADAWGPAISLILVIPPTWFLLLYVVKHPLFFELTRLLKTVTVRFK